jgi:hypothetical protein
MGSGLLKNASEVLAVASEMPRRRAVALRPFLGGDPRLRGGQAETAAQIYLEPPPVELGVVRRDNGDGSPHADLRNIRQPGLWIESVSPSPGGAVGGDRAGR